MTSRRAADAGIKRVEITMRETARLFKNAFTKWNAKDPFRESAVIAYYAIFSLPGLLLLVITMAGSLFGRDEVSVHLHSQINDTMGKDAADAMQAMVAKGSRGASSLGVTIVGIVTILVGATAVFVQLQKSFNVIWEVQAQASKSGVWTFLKARLFSFGLILSIAFLLLVSLVLSSILAATSRWMEAHWPPYMLFLFKTTNVLLSFSVVSALFALMFKWLPDARVKWRYVWVGAFLTGLLFEIGKLGLGFYFGKMAPGSGYGAAGSVILILLWTSYSTMIVFFGAEFTKAFADHFHGAVSAGENAVRAPGQHA